jgi:hypothetical protein
LGMRRGERKCATAREQQNECEMFCATSHSSSFEP